MKKSEEFTTIELGTTYHISKYRVIDNKGIQKCDDADYEQFQDSSLVKYEQNLQKITFVRGDKSDNGVIIPRVDGVLHEQLLGMMITDLEYKNSLVPNEFTMVAIMNLKSALKQLEFRQQDRELRNVIGTYQK